jgi:hypothetical protein
MAFQSRFVPESNYIEIEYKGNISTNELIEAAVASLDLARKNAISRFLADCTNLSGGHSVIDLYELISLYESLGIPRNFKEAVLLPAIPKSVDNVKFYETASTNRGYSVKIFDNREEALTWLDL